MGSLDRGVGARVGANSLNVAGRSIRLRAKDRFEDPDGAVEAVRALMEEPDLLENWATRCLNHDRNPYDSPVAFRFSEIPGPSRQGAMESIAVAYLAAGQPVPEHLREEVHIEFGS